jgi:GAF domain-containing protein
VRKRAEEELRVRTRKLPALSYLGQQMLAGLEIEMLMTETAYLIAQILGAPDIAVWEILPDRHTLQPRAAVGGPEAAIGKATLRISRDHLAGRTLLVTEPVVLSDVQAELCLAGEMGLSLQGVRSGVGVPIGGRDGPNGALCAYSPQQHPFSNGDLYFLQSAANKIAFAIERQETEVRMHRLQGELFRVTRASAIGELGSTLAHELNQPIASVMN